MAAAYKGLDISPLDPFTRGMWMNYSGASKIFGGQDPLYGETDFATVIISGDSANPESKDVYLEVNVGEDRDDFIYTSEPISFQKALRAAKKLLNAQSIDELVDMIEDEMPFLREFP